MSDAQNDTTKVEAYRKRMAEQVAAIKTAVLAWLEPIERKADSVCITNALLEVALDRHVALHDAGAFDLIESAYRRALKRGNVIVQ